MLRTVALPIGRHIRTDDGFRFEAAKMLNDAFGYVMNEGVRGDYAEFGVFRGGTFLEAWYATQRFRLTDVTLHAYDSFEGLPSIDGPDDGGPFVARQFASPRGVFDATTAIIPRERMTVTGGFFADTLRTAPTRRLAIAFIDCDLYASTVPVLDFLTSQVQDGSIIVFDDWFCFHARPDQGEQRACAEWLARHPEIRLVPYRDFHWAGRSFIVNRG